MEFLGGSGVFLLWQEQHDLHTNIHPFSSVSPKYSRKSFSEGPIGAAGAEELELELEESDDVEDEECEQQGQY